MSLPMEKVDALFLLMRIRRECVDHELSGLVGDIVDVYAEQGELPEEPDPNTEDDDLEPGWGDLGPPCFPLDPERKEGP